MTLHNLTTEQLADLGLAFQWHAMHRDKLLDGARRGVTYQDAAKYRDEALLRAGLPPLATIDKALLDRIDAAVIARRET